MNFGYTLGLMLCLVSCTGSGETDVSADDVDGSWSFAANFDTATSMMDLFPADLSGWTNVQCVPPSGQSSSTPSALLVVSGANRIALDSTHVVSGARALRAEAPPTGSSVSKAAIAKEGLAFKPGDRVLARFELYLDDRGSVENLFLMDLESTELSGYPGRRLTISSSQELVLESKNTGKSYGSGPNFKQSTASKVPIPKGQWVSIEIELALARDETGSAKIWQDGVLVVSGTGQTFPSEANITRYDWVEFGITANSSTTTQSLWIDDISLSSG